MGVVVGKTPRGEPDRGQEGVEVGVVAMQGTEAAAGGY